MRIRTSRLVLSLATFEQLTEDLRGGDKLAALLAAHVPATWPPDLYDAAAVRFALDGLSGQGPDFPWGFYYLLLQVPDDVPTLIGAGGFKGRQTREGKSRSDTRCCPSFGETATRPRLCVLGYTSRFHAVRSQASSRRPSDCCRLHRCGGVSRDAVCRHWSGCRRPRGRGSLALRDHPPRIPVWALGSAHLRALCCELRGSQTAASPDDPSTTRPSSAARLVRAVNISHINPRIYTRRARPLESQRAIAGRDE